MYSTWGPDTEHILAASGPIAPRPVLPLNVLRPRQDGRHDRVTVTVTMPGGRGERRGGLAYRESVSGSRGERRGGLRYRRSVCGRGGLGYCVSGRGGRGERRGGLGYRLGGRGERRGRAFTSLDLDGRG